MAQLLKHVVIVLATAVVGGLLFALTTSGHGTFVERFAGAAGLLGSLLIGYVLGAHADLARRRKQGGALTFAGLAIVVFGALAFAIGLSTPPIIGESENHILFPSLVLVGLVAGLVGGTQKF